MIASTVVRDLLGIALGAVFVLSSIRKAKDPTTTEGFLRASLRLSERQASLAVGALISVELVTGLLLLAGGSRVAGVLALVLFVSFVAATIASHRIGVPCGCAGPARITSAPKRLLRNLAPRAVGLAAAAVLALSAPPLLRVPTAPALLVAGLTSLLCVGAIAYRAHEEQPGVNARRQEVGLSAISRRRLMIGSLSTLGVFALLPRSMRQASAKPDCWWDTNNCPICALAFYMVCLSACVAAQGNPVCISYCTQIYNTMRACCVVCGAECARDSLPGNCCGALRGCFGCFKGCDNL